MEDRPIVDEREIRVPVSETKVQAEVEQESMGIAVKFGAPQLRGLALEVFT